MKSIKLRPSHLKGNLEKLLTHCNAVDLASGRAFPDLVYMSKNDYKTLQKNIIDKYGKYEGGMYLLNLGPSTLLQNSVKDGWVIVDNEAIINCKLIQD